MNPKIEKQFLAGHFSSVLQEPVDVADITLLLQIADSLAGGQPAFSFSMLEEGKPQLFRLVPTCPCPKCSAVTLQADDQPSEPILKAFLKYVQTRLAVMEGPEKGVLH
jgi:hypothetical protein